MLYGGGVHAVKRSRSLTEATDWSQSVERIVFLFNPKASNYARAERWARAIADRIGMEMRRIDVTKDMALVGTLTSAADSRASGRTLVLIAGGDGTINSIVAELIKSNPKQATSQLLLLPLWGGNANDLSCMLNGLSSKTSVRRLLERAASVRVPLIQLRIQEPDKQQTLYACCYASFGASAYAARQLDNRGLARRKLLQYLPPVIMLRELAVVLKSLLQAPQFIIETVQEGKLASRKIYEHTLVNGPRLAKVSRVPVSLTEPLFFHAAVSKKSPSLVIELLRIASRRRSPIYAKTATHTFTVQTAIDAQIDGEVYRLVPGAEVTASVVWPAFRWVSVRYLKDAERTRTARPSQ